MSDEDIREGEPERPRKKKPAPASGADEDRPRKKRPAEEDEDEAPRKKKKPAKNEDDEDDLGSSPLSAIVPVGGSIWALLSFYIALLSCIVPIPLLGLIAVGLGILAFVTHKHKASYGSLTGSIRAILGILIGAFTMVASTVILILYFMGKLG